MKSAIKDQFVYLLAASRQQHIDTDLCCGMEWCRGFTALVLHFARRLGDVNAIPHDGAVLTGVPGALPIGVHCHHDYDMPSLYLYGRLL
jgi:hypothetical protein